MGRGGAFGLRPYQVRRLVLGAVLAAIVITGTALALTGGDDDEPREVIFLEGEGDLGPNPFTTQRTCDAAELTRQLQADRAKAQEWVSALNDDPTVEWSGNRAILATDIPAYTAELAIGTLIEDTRVTNHGYSRGQATPRQSVLQDGTAVMVDAEGFARVRCLGGNPLTRPREIENPEYQGECWEGCRDHPYCAGETCTRASTTTSSSSTSSSSSSTTTPATTPRSPTTTRPRPTTTRPPTTTTTAPPVTSTLPEDTTTTDDPGSTSTTGT